MMSQSGIQTNAIQILSNISRSKGNQTMKFNMRNNFLEKSYTKYGGETIPKTFSENSNLGISVDQ